MITESLHISHSNRIIEGTIQLTGSKSESNRALIIQSLAQGKVKVDNLSKADDTDLLSAALAIANQKHNQRPTIDIGPAGTAMRFLTSYLNLLDGEFLLTGSQRMQQRPIGILVDALAELGADIAYENQAGFPPLHIRGKMKQKTSQIRIKGDISSQYISSLLLIAPALEQGLVIDIDGELTSRPYVTMTLEMLKESGIQSQFHGGRISIEPQDFAESTLLVEPDWSAASYWYAMVALAEEGNVILPGLKPHSLQGDIAIMEIMKHFGVASNFEPEGLRIYREGSASDKKLFDFKTCPDLAQTIVVVAAALQRDVSFTGLETLRIKETDRILALQNEIAKFGAELLEQTPGVFTLKTQHVSDPGKLVIDTYEDHRMAMAFAPLALVFDHVQIQEPSVVEKSYPMFWEHLKDQGFEVHS
ncbi:MAG: 3-phosphoshikimate 1-carboxyvinyltransferase [Sphingobacterium sp.]